MSTFSKLFLHFFIAVSLSGILSLPKANAQNRCQVPIPASEFDPYLSAIKGESFSSNQMEVAKQVENCLSTAQIRKVMDIFSFENMKLEYAKWAYPYCTDPKNYYLLNAGLTYSSSKSELSQFVKGQAAKTTPVEVKTEPEPVAPPVQKEVKTRKTGWEPTRTVPDPYTDPFKEVEQNIKSFFVMTLGNENHPIDPENDVHTRDEDPSNLPAKAPRVIITNPELNEDNQFTASTSEKKLRVSGVISSSVGIYEVYINQTEAVLNPKGDFFADVLLSPGENNISIRAKDTQGQKARIDFKVIRQAGAEPPPVTPKETVKEEPVPVKPEPTKEFVSEIDTDIPKLGKVNKDAIAVVIGNRKYSRVKPVDFAENDARSMKAYLMNVLGYKEGNILYYENASLGEMNTLFGTRGNPKGKLFNTIKQGVSDVVIFYSGHGAPGLKSGKAYFVPVEADPNYLENSGYELDVLYENLKKLPAKSILFLSDACFSGADVFDKISPMVIRSKEPAKEGMKNTTLINSCSGTEVSCWHNEEKHGLFTFYFLKALKDYKATDLNKDRQISLDEVFTSLSDNNEGVPYYARRQYGLSQTPLLQGPKTRILFKY